MPYKKYWVPCIFLSIICFINGCQKEGANNGGQAEDRQKLACVVATDFYMVHFTAYLEPTQDDLKDRKKAFSPYCQDLPRIGKSYLTVDMLDADVKGTPISAKIIARTNGTVQEVLSLPAKTYPTGIIEMSADFRAAGEYLIELGIGRTVAAEDTIRIPLRVALLPPMSAKLTQLGFALGGLLVLALLLSFAYRYWRAHRVQARA